MGKQRTSGRSANSVLLLWVLAAWLGGCGGGGGAAAPVATAELPLAPLTIYTFGLPPASVGQPYEDVQLDAEATSGASVTWRLHEGPLPPGLTLDSDGTLWGAPEEQGVYAFTVHASDGVNGATRTLALAVDAFGLCVFEGLVAGEAWSGRPVRLCAAGQEGPVRFSLARQEDGQLLHPNEPNGTATFIPAWVSSGLETIEVRAEDLTTGRQGLLLLDVRADPTAAFQAEFTSTDVWHIDTTALTGDHGYASDFQAALALSGFRDPSSVDLFGTQADDLAARYIRLQVLREIGRFFLHEGDGTPGAAGLAVSLAHDEPVWPYTKPAAGATSAGSPGGYSALRLEWLGDHGALATALVDSPWNELHENNASSNDRGPFGLFLAEIIERYNESYATAALVANPVTADDVPALHALIHGLPDPGGRYATLAHFGTGLARSLATVCAHEMGHGMGLLHTSPADIGSLMNAALYIGPLRRPAFTPADLEQLRTKGLPGVGRSSVQALQKSGAAGEAAQLPAGGIAVCRSTATD